MELTNIELNRPYKPRELCNLLGVPFPEQTKYRRKFYDDLSSLFVWHKQGYSIVIDEIISSSITTPDSIRKKSKTTMSFTYCISELSKVLPEEFTDEDLFKVIFNHTFEELTDTSAYTGYSKDFMYDFTWCLKNKLYSKYHTALNELHKNHGLYYRFLDTATGEISSNPTYTKIWDGAMFGVTHNDFNEKIFKGYSYTNYRKTLESLHGSMPLYRLVQNREEIINLREVYTNIYQHTFNYIYKSFVPKCSDKISAGIKASQLVRRWCKDNFGIVFTNPKGYDPMLKYNEPDRYKEPKQIKPTRFTDCMRYRIDKYMRENDKDSLTYDEICTALYGQSVRNFATFDCDYKPLHMKFDEEKQEWVEYKSSRNLKTNIERRISQGIFTTIEMPLNAMKSRKEASCRLYVEDKGEKRLANFEETEVILVRNRRIACLKQARQNLKEIREDLSALGVSYLPKEFTFNFKKVKDYSSCEEEVQKILDEYLLRRVYYEFEKNIKMKNCISKAYDMINTWAKQKLTVSSVEQG